MACRFLYSFILYALASPFLSAVETKSPNIIYILADDLGYGDIGVYGQTEIQTPNIDRMADEGLLFTNHYAGSTVCAPSRCSVLTGLDQGHARIRGNLVTELTEDDVTVAEELQRAGYATAMIGKWGLGDENSPGDPHKHGFDHYLGYLNHMHAHNHYPAWLIKNSKKVYLNNSTKFLDVPYDKDPGSASTEKNEYSQDLFTADALRFIEENKEGPFFLYFAPIIPHANNEGHIVNHHGMEVPNLGAYIDKAWPNPEKSKAAMISYLDKDVGRILQLIQDLGIANDTLVIFTSDNGPHREGEVNPEFFNSSGDLRGAKRDLYEGGIRVPMIAWWPGTIASDGKTDHISAFWDVKPTFVELAGRAAPENSNGISFTPTLLGKPNQLTHDYLYWEFHETGGTLALRQGKWKAVKQNVNVNPDAMLELYDLSMDPMESNNVAPKYPAVVQQIEALLKVSRTKSPILEYNFSQH